MIRTALCIVLAGTVGFACAETAQEALSKITEMNSKVTGYETLMEVHDARGESDMVASSTMAVSREFGWKITDNSTTNPHFIVNDFKTSYEYVPEANKVFKFTATQPKIAEDFRRPADELNLLSILDPASIKMTGSDTFEGEPVYKFEGTTTTQFMPQGRPIVRSVEAWISTRDGMPRKTLESAGQTTGVTIYRNVKVNPPFKAEDFQYTVAPGVQVIDINAEMAKQATRQPANAKPATDPKQK